MVRQRFVKMRHMWTDKHLHFNLRLRLYRACVCSILTWGSEAWKLNDEASKAINGANSKMLCIITGRTPHQEASKESTFSLIMWIRARRMQWLGHILRMGSDRKVKQAVYEMYREPSCGDLLMDAPKTQSWHDLLEMGADREGWATKVRSMTQKPIACTIKTKLHFNLNHKNANKIKKSKSSAPTTYQKRDTHTQRFSARN